MQLTNVIISSLIENNMHRSNTATHVVLSEIDRLPVLYRILFDKAECYIVFKVHKVSKGVV